MKTPFLSSILLLSIVSVNHLFAQTNVNSLLLAADNPVAVITPVTPIKEAGSNTEATMVATASDASFKSLTATFNKQKVVLQWELPAGQSSNAFYVQRYTGGAWKDVALVFCKESSADMSSFTYQYKEDYSLNNITQYRIEKVDADGKVDISNTCSVIGEKNNNRLAAHSNSGAKGKLNLVITDGIGKDVVLRDASDQIIKEYNSLTTTNLNMDNLAAGYYTIQIVDTTKGLTTVQKIFIK